MSQTNPVHRQRQSYGMTQKALADHLSVTVQVVVNAEAGLFNSLPDSFIQVLHVSQEEYQVWVYGQRRRNQAYFDDKPTHLGWAVFKDSVNPSNRGFCRYLVFQPSILREYEKYKRSKPLLAQALSDVGLSHEELVELKFNVS